jgi:pimeloyl-ACP methyl ester carboxylesterase
MKWQTHLTLTVAALMLLTGCATPNNPPSDLWYIDKSHLPEPDVALKIPGLGPCTDNPDRTLHLNSQQPVTVLVHGCFGSSGLFRGLAQVLAFHGQQTACFTYNDRDALMKSSGQLTAALDQLGQQMGDKHVTVIGHSQGALIARKALVRDRADPISNSDLKLRLVTVSGPFGGIASADACGNKTTRVLTLGLIGLMCEIVTGDKWEDITYTSDFILHPGPLHPQVSEYIKVETDEAGTCRRFENGRCAESDDVFSLQEQQNPVIDHDPMTHIELVNAGHVEIVGDKHIAPVKLISVLQKDGILNPTEPNRMADLNLLLQKVYGAGY